MFFVVGFHGCLEGCECAVDFLVDGNVDFCRSGPEDYNAVNAFFFLEVADVFAELFDHIPAVFCVLDVVAVETFCIVVVESCFEGFDGFEFLADGVDVFLFEDFSIHC